MQELVRCADIDGDGTIGEPLPRCPVSPQHESVLTLQIAVDSCRSAEARRLWLTFVPRGARADWEEFLAATCHLNRLTQNEHLQRAFSHFDRDNSGTITADEIMEALKGQGVSQEEADELLAEWDANRDGAIRRAHGCSPRLQHLSMLPCL